MSHFRCIHCGRLAKLTRRRLCYVCYRDEDVRLCYQGGPRGGWRQGARVWTVDESARLMALYEDGLSDREIARAMDRSLGSVTGARQRLGLRVDAARQGGHRTRAALARESDQRSPATHQPKGESP